jgi:glycine/D-amino acid oxidase-like deaminating enzyme
MNVDVAIVGAGQAGLSVSQQLTERGIEHLVLERHDIGESWRRRWDSFCLVTPNWSVMLPGYPYDGADPDGFMPRDEIVAFLKRHAASFSAPVKTAVTVDKVETGDRFELTTSDGPVTARSLVLATGAFQKPRRPRGAELVPKDIYQIDLRRLPQSGWSARWCRAYRRQRSVRLPDRRRTPPGRTPGDLGLWPRALGAPPDQRSRSGLVADGSRIFRSIRQGPSAGGAAPGQYSG